MEPTDPPAGAEAPDDKTTGTGASPQPTLERPRPAASAPTPQPATSPVADSDVDQQPSEDLSGRPPLAEVAQQRAQNVVERRLPAEEE